MDISTELVKELREKTGCGILDCKKALVEKNANIDEAIKFLREKGLASAEKKSGRTTKEGAIFSYIHGAGRIGVMLEVNCETDFVARTEKFQSFVKDIAMHVAALNPRFISSEDITEEVKNLEKEIYKKQALDSGKPEKIVEKIVEGKMNKFAEEVCLLEQAYVKNPDIKVKDYLKEQISVLGENISVKRFIRWQLGE